MFWKRIFLLGRFISGSIILAAWLEGNDHVPGQVVSLFLHIIFFKLCCNSKCKICSFRWTTIGRNQVLVYKIRCVKNQMAMDVILINVSGKDIFMFSFQRCICNLRFNFMSNIGICDLDPSHKTVFQGKSYLCLRLFHLSPSCEDRLPYLLSWTWSFSYESSFSLRV